MLPEPNPNDIKYKPKFGAIIFSKRNQEKEIEKFQKDKEAWKFRVQKRIERYNETNRNLKLNYERQLKEYEDKCKKFNEDYIQLWETEKEKIVESNKQLKIRYLKQLKKYDGDIRKVETWKKDRRIFYLNKRLFLEVMDS